MYFMRKLLILAQMCDRTFGGFLNILHKPRAVYPLIWLFETFGVKSRQTTERIFYKQLNEFSSNC